MLWLLIVDFVGKVDICLLRLWIFVCYCYYLNAFCLGLLLALLCCVLYVYGYLVGFGSVVCVLGLVLL